MEYARGVISIEPKDGIRTPIGLAPSGEPGFKFRTHGDDQGRAAQVFRVAGAQLESVRLAAGWNDAYRLKAITTNDLHPIMNDCEA